MKNFIGNFLASLTAFVVGLVVVGFINVMIFAGLVANLSFGKSIPFFRILSYNITVTYLFL